MGAGNSKKSDPAILLQRSIDGDLGEIKHLAQSFLSASKDDSRSDKEKLAEFVNAVDAQGNSALHGAVFAGHEEVTKYLVEECGSDLDLPNGLGCSPLWLAAGYDRVDVLKYILETHPEPKRAICAANKTDDTPLIAACSRGNVKACEMLCQYIDQFNLATESVGKRNKSGDHALLVAIAGGHQGAIIDVLLGRSEVKDLNEPNIKGLTPFLIACERDDVELASKLLEKGAEWDVRDSNGSSPLAIAAFCGNKRIVDELLLEKKDLLDRQNNNGCTALWLATRAGRPEIVQQLFDAGCDVTLQNKDGFTPLDAAKKYNRKDIVDLLQAAASQ